MGKRDFILVGVPLLLLTAAACGLSLTSGNSPPAKARAFAERRPQRDLCGSRKAYQELKARVFAEAEGIRGSGAANLDLLSSFSSVRVEEPLLKSRDDDLGVTVCTGRFVLLLAPGAERGTGGRRYLRANVEYAALPASDGSGLVYQLRGADSIIYRLAAFNLRGDPSGAAPATDFASFDPSELLPPPPPPPVVKPFPDPPAIVPAPDDAEMVPKAPPLPVKDSTLASRPKRVEAAKETKKASAPRKAKRVELAAASGTVKKPLDKSKTEPLAQSSLRKGDGKPSKSKRERTTEAAKNQPAKSAKGSKDRAPALGKAVKAAKLKKPDEKATLKKSTEKPSKLAKGDKPELEAKTGKAEKIVKLAASKTEKTAKLARSEPAPKPKAAVKTKGAALAPLQAAESQAPRSKCAAPGSTAERLLCDNPKLAAKKRSATNFQNAALEEADAETRRILNRTRGQFSDYVHRCASESCLDEAYDQRIQEIREIMADTH